jgi:hypothetical protein
MTYRERGRNNLFEKAKREGVVYSFRNDKHIDPAARGARTLSLDQVNEFLAKVLS